ncbi:PREDICTED: CCR4-NOT transcription complex subunit 2-like [Amphimedon queenslandica]|uniref:NOT2/NOT3/NOT5 C-terminal domain-containing protein n=1 Tax=Amphimedon queenslandica TaxID=400682 RepID=A0A1X7UGA7_AMPQE|nr:PREDICTED: CCR4-NOT transcription complex subunit 2-like [Amphimedon queenslandica]|eukprot:XP_019854269.1 PREDICTED: CCR4-NOT transcription complex subunit 2-like [Amphimedon queenslandica]
MYYTASNSSNARKSSQEMASSTAIGSAPPQPSNLSAMRRGVMMAPVLPLGGTTGPVKKKELDEGFMTQSYYNQQSSFLSQQRTDKDGLTPTGLYGMSTGFQSAHPSSRGLTNTPPFSRSSTAPTYTNNMGGGGGGATPGLPGQYGAPSPPPSRNNLFINSGAVPGGALGVPHSQGVGPLKHVSRPNTLASAISSGLPLNSYPGLGGNGRGGMMSSFSSTGYSSLSEMSAQSGFDPSEFPVLGIRSHGDSGLLLGGNRPGYAGQISKPTETSQEFQMRVEDFPSLPGTSTKTSESSELSQESAFTTSTSTNPLPESRSTLPYDPAPGGGNKERSSSIGAIGSNSKNVTRKTAVNVPPNMVQDHYGMVGLLTFIRGAETDPNLVALALGSDLTTLGLHLNSPESLYSTFSSPFADSPSRPQDIDYPVPQEYLIHSYIRDKLAPIRLSKYNEDLLFYLYYTSGGDLLQLLAAHELYTRDWRYHKEEKIWITRAPNMRPTKVETTYEEGTYCYFDLGTWRKAHRDMKVEYDRLAERPSIPPAITSQQIVSSVSMSA